MRFASNNECRFYTVRDGVVMCRVGKDEDGQASRDVEGQRESACCMHWVGGGVQVLGLSRTVRAWSERAYARDRRALAGSLQLGFVKTLRGAK